VVRNPNWIRDELILALDCYLTHRSNLPAKDSESIQNLSTLLHRLWSRLGSQQYEPTFRNRNGAYMKLMNFRRFDPTYTELGKVGLVRGNKLEKEVWDEFSHDRERCHQVALAIGAYALALSNTPLAEMQDAVEEASEGRLLTRIHITRERNQRLVAAKKKTVLAKEGRLRCDCCSFDFHSAYGERGEGFIECHHTKPLATMEGEGKTHTDDLALVCANCHRIIHRGSPWLSIADLRHLLADAKKKADNGALLTI